MNETGKITPTFTAVQLLNLHFFTNLCQIVCHSTHMFTNEGLNDSEISLETRAVPESLGKRSCQQALNMIHTTQEEIKKKLLKLDTSNTNTVIATRCHHRFCKGEQKQCPNHQPRCMKSVNIGQLPEVWKMVNLVPIVKKGITESVKLQANFADMHTL